MASVAAARADPAVSGSRARTAANGRGGAGGGGQNGTQHAVAQVLVATCVRSAFNVDLGLQRIGTLHCAMYVAVYDHGPWPSESLSSEVVFHLGFQHLHVNSVITSMLPWSLPMLELFIWAHCGTQVLCAMTFCGHHRAVQLTSCSAVEARSCMTVMISRFSHALF